MFYIISSRSEKFPPRCRQRVRKLLQFLVCFGCTCYCSRPVGGPSWAKSLQIRPAGTFDSESQRKSTFCPPPFHGEMIIFGIKISIISRRSMHDGSKTGSKVNFGKLSVTAMQAKGQTSDKKVLNTWRHKHTAVAF